jgi:hypothetical protein
MRDRLNELTWWIRSAIGRLTGNPPQNPDGRLGFTPTSTVRQDPRAARPSVSRFRVSVGQMTIDEHLVGQAEAAGRHDKAARNE